MDSEPKIPFSYRRVQGQLQKGDGIYDPDIGKFAKVRREHVEVVIKKRRVQWPCAKPEDIAIRRCEVEQPELPGTADAHAQRTITVHYPNGEPRLLNRKEYEDIKATGMLWEFHPDAPLHWPEEPLNLDE